MLFSSFWKRGPGPPLWGPGGVLGPLDPPPLDPPQGIDIGIYMYLDIVHSLTYSHSMMHDNNNILLILLTKLHFIA